MSESEETTTRIERVWSVTKVSSESDNTSMRKKNFEEQSTSSSSETMSRWRKFQGESQESSEAETSTRKKKKRKVEEEESQESSEAETSTRKKKKKGKVEAAVVRGSINEILVEPENRPKLVCIFLEGDDVEKEGRIIGNVHNGLFNLHDGAFFHGLAEPEPGYPPHLFQNFSYGVACLGSKVYFIGGCNYSILFNDVSVFDLTTRLWTSAPALNHPRPCPAVLPYQNNLYIFGSRTILGFPGSPSPPLTPDTFIEYYDATSNKWHYVPSKLPQELLNPRTFILSHAFSEAKGVAYFWVHAIGVYSYDFKSMTWAAPFKSLNAFHPNVGLIWSNKAVFLDSFLIWHHFGTIYSFNVSNHALRAIFTFPKPFRRFGNPYEWMHDASPSYIINVGNGKLCLVYGRQHNNDSDSVRCHVFDVLYSRTSPHEDVVLSLTHKGCKRFHHKSYDVSSVFTVELKEDIHLIEKIPTSSDDHDRNLKTIFT